jgi:hypothetical protein
MPGFSASTLPGVPAQQPVVITDLNSLRRLGERRFFRSSHPIVVRLPKVPTDAAEAIANRINGYRNECGCSLGAKATTVGLGVMITWLTLSSGLFTSQFLWRLPLVFVGALGCAGLGKSAGIALARRRLRIELEQLSLSLSTITEEATCQEHGQK